MYLKSIEIQGFKSFANKIKLEFNDGITGIVGPNGSGKSNIADAVRWVLGEQKVKQLRSAGMQDVIFAGTQNRKSVSFAYVAITLDNSDRALGLDYSEVTVARRLYRSGESEYLLNGTVCRLKDVHELFYDTGIGKEGYSIIGQGQIEKILSGRPEERRELFDEAAGIVKFKRRKQMTVKKLEAEQQNMVRIADILAELEHRVGPLARQSEHARAYLKKKEALREADLQLFLLEMERMEAEETSLLEKADIAESQQAETKARHELLRKTYEELDAKLQESDVVLAALREKIGEKDVEKEKAEGRINVLKEQIHSIEQGESHVKFRLEELDEEIARRREVGEGYTKEKEEIDAAVAAAAEKKEAASAALSQMQERATALEASLEAGKTEMLRLLEARSAIKGEQQRFAPVLEQAEIRKAALQQQILSRKSTEGDAAGQLQQQEEALASLNERILSMEKKKITVDQKRRKWKEQAVALHQERETIAKQLLKETSRLEALKNIAERYDGYGNSIRRVMEQKGKVPGIHGVVADLIQVEKRYETAIETALGGSIQNIVPDTPQPAKSLLSVWKTNRLGRATFLPLTSMSTPDHIPAKKALSEQGVVGLADTLVKTAPAYETMVASLLGRILVVDTIDHAIAIARKYSYSLRMVTLEGESFLPGGSMTGGAFKNNSNLLGRNREIEGLEKQLLELKEQEKKIRARLEDIETADELLSDDYEEITTALQDFYLRQNTLKVEVEHLQEEKEKQEAFFFAMQEELDKIEAEQAKAKEEKAQALLQAKQSKERQEQLKDEAEEQTAALAELQKQLEEQQKEVSEAAVALATEQQKSDFVRENIQRVAEEMLTLQHTREDVLSNASNAEEAIAEREAEIVSLEKACTEIAGQKEGLLEELSTATAEKEAKGKAHKGYLQEREQLGEDLSRLDKELFRLQDRLERLEQAKDALTEYMWQEYELTRHQVHLPAEAEVLEVPALKKRIAEIKDEIKKLGNVNVNAIEEYKEVAERYEFLKTQHEDLAQAEKTLLDIIADLDEGMKKQFSARFADIQREFDKAFQALFGGGKGTLELTLGEDKDILECGIGIVAQPPGKKLVNMMQLSGGEKALTAIALLFAIQNLKPSPFCLLDEIEAALDDPNVERYAKYLHKLTKHTQFIVITHRRGTMIAADCLYGITMQEKGVSSLVSVNLIEKELEA